MMSFSKTVCLALCLLVGASARLRAGDTLPTLEGSWCATGHDSLSVDGVAEQNDSVYSVCMDAGNIRWSQMFFQADNKTPKQLNLLTDPTTLYKINYSSTGAPLTCLVQKTAPNTVQDTPFTFTNIDSGATVQGTEMVGDDDLGAAAVECTDYMSHRPAYVQNGVSLPEEYMHWYGDDNNEMMRAACMQQYDVSPGDGGTAHTQFGNRTFVADYSAADGIDDASYAVPDGVTCHHVNSGLGGFEVMF